MGGGKIHARRTLQRIQVLRRRFAFTVGQSAVGVKEYGSTDSSGRLLSFGFVISNELTREMIRAEILRRIETANTNTSEITT